MGTDGLLHFSVFTDTATDSTRRLKAEVFEWLESSILRAEIAFRQQDRKLLWQPNHSASADDISLVESRLGILLPPSLKTFFLMHNGASLQHDGNAIDYKTDEYHVIILGTLDLVSASQRQSFESDDDFSYRSGTLLFGKTIDGQGEHLILDPARLCNGEYPVANAAPYFWRDWRDSLPIALSFENWLHRSFDALAAGEDARYWFGSS